MANQYVFLPWLRRGLASQLPNADPLTAAPSAETRSLVNVSIKIMGDEVEKASVDQQVALVGTGDIRGINTSAIVKTDPAAGTRNFEPNFFPYIEFYEEDFLWRYSPAKAAGDRRLRPWLALLVLEETEFERISATAIPGTKAIRILANPVTSVFPPPSQIWAWSHVQVNDGNLLAADLADPGSRNQKIAGSLNNNPNLGVCRLLSQRKLKPATKYYAFLVPSFEKGRLAGLGGKKAAIDAVSKFDPSWGAAGNDGRFPVYYEWSFNTGQEDFEALAKKISPRDLTGTDVGKLWMDAADINYGSNFNYKGNLEPLNAARRGFLPFEGALRLPGPAAPNMTQRAGADEKEFADHFSKLINLGVQYRQKLKTDLQWSVAALGNDNDDPLLVPPIYGRWYVKPDGGATVDPGLQNNWLEQLNLDPALRVAAGLGTEIVKEHQEEYMSRSWEQLSDYRRSLNAQMHRLGFAQEITKATFQKHFSQGAALTDNTASKVLAFTQSIQTTIKSDQADVSIAGKLSISRADAAFVQPAYRRMTRTNGPVMKKVQTKASYTNLIMGGSTQFVVLGFFAIMADPPYQNFNAAILKTVDPNNFTFVPGPWPNVVIMLQNPNWLPENPGMFLTDRAKFPGIAKDLLNNLLPKPLLSKPPVFDLKLLGQKILARILPTTSFTLQYQSMIPADAPPAVATSEVISPNSFNPFFTDPTFERLGQLRPELFIPNLDKIEPESFVLLQANSAFIASYLVGMNHELGAEFLWRGFPADLNATFFRQFWDVSDSPASSLNPDKSDIKPIRQWKLTNQLGMNGNVQNPLVFVIKAELVKKYPNLVVYAQKAVLKPEGRIPDPSSAPLMPLFLSHLGPDFLFAGFNLTREKVLGLPTSGGAIAGGPAGGQDKDGWYFVIAERPGEMHFGLDQSRNADRPYASWNDLAWTDLPADTVCIDLEKHIPATPAAKNGWEWGKGQTTITTDPAAGTGDAAQMAAILQQRPVQIFIHASMLVK